MINRDSFKFQNPHDADHTWVETMLFPVVVPEEDIYALIYLNVRPVLGVMWSQVMISGSLTQTRADLLHYNENHFQPSPKDLLDVDSTLGFQIRSEDPMAGFNIDYVHDDGTEIHVSWENLMLPFDVHDPSHSPQAGANKADMHTDAGSSGYSASGHFDMHGRVQGVMKVRGREFAVDSIERMDHSWGPRDPMKVANMFIVSATFDEGLFFHMICPWDPSKKGADAIQLAHGYVVEDGVTYGLTKDATITAQHLGLVCAGLQMEVTDVRGKKFKLEASPNIGAPWIAGPNAITHNALMRWRHDDRTGYGVVMKNHSLKYLNSECGRFSDELSTPIYV